MSGATVQAVPSYLHEALVELVRDRPELAVELLTEVFGAVLPAYATATVESGDLTDLAPTEYRADSVVVLRNTAGRPVWGVVVEVQLNRDPDKRWSWRSYLGVLSGRQRCPVTLLVIAPDRGVAVWCAEPIDLGLPGTPIGQLVLGPERVPRVRDPQVAGRRPELAVLSAIAHGGADVEVLGALPAAFAAIDPDHAALYCDIVLAALPRAARNHLEALVRTGTYEYQSDFARGYVAQGRADAVLTVLAARGVEVPEPARARITGCADLGRLDAWVRRAVTAHSVDELFVDDA